MNGSFLLDTNIVIALFAAERIVKEKIRQADKIFVPSVVLGELYYGALISGRVKENMNRLNAFAGDQSVLVCDLVTARMYGEVKHGLRQKGRPIPENDIWIAAIALQHDLTLVARDSHFEEVEGLRIEKC